MPSPRIDRARIALMVALLGLVGASVSSEGVKPQKLKKISKGSGSCHVVKLPEGVLLHAHPYAVDRGALFFPANVFSITVLKGGQRVEPTSRETVPEEMVGGFQGKMIGTGMKAVFPPAALSSDSEIIVDYTGAGFAGKSDEDSKARFRFDPKHLR